MRVLCNGLEMHLEEPIVLVMVSASYHSVLLNEPPTSTIRKTDIQEWLMKNNMNYDKSMLKTKLLFLVKEK